jgi:very-short-patch-repair endonuclease
VDVDDREWILGRAAEMRAAMPDAEVILWSHLRRRALDGYRFRRQYIVGRAILDFYCPQRRLAIEVDGPTHDPTDDDRRDGWLATKGIRVMRFDNDDVYRHLEDVLGEIRLALMVQPGKRPRNQRVR